MQMCVYMYMYVFMSMYSSYTYVTNNVMSSLRHIIFTQQLQEERKNVTEEVDGAEVGVAEMGVAEEGEGQISPVRVNLPSLKPDAALVPHHAAALAGTQTPLSLATPSLSPQSQSLAAPLSSMVSWCTMG